MVKLFIVFYLLLFHSISSICANNEKAHVIIVAGQSNSDGRVPIEYLPDYIKNNYPDTFNYCKISYNDSHGNFVAYRPQTKWKRNTKTWGFDTILYYYLEKKWNKTFYVIKWSVGGTSIAPYGRWSWNADPEWLSNNKPSYQRGKSLLLSLLHSIDSCIDCQLSRLDNGYHIDAFVWHQGESDNLWANDYYDNLSQLVIYLRDYISKKTGKDYSTLPFIFGTVSKRNNRYNSVVEDAMRKFSETDKNAYLIDMSEAELLPDRLHFNSKSSEYLGRQVFEIINNLYQ